MKLSLVTIFLAFSIFSFGQDTIRLNFLYGSRSAKDFKKSEAKLLGE